VSEPQTPAFNERGRENKTRERQQVQDEQALNQMGVCLLEPGRKVPEGYEYGLLVGPDKAYFIYLRDGKDMAGLSTAE
jgi:hypothetical protein